MNILDHRALPGPNAHSRYPTIHMLLDIGRYEGTPSNTIPGFTAALVEAMPTLREHRCSEGHSGGFIARLREGTWVGHVVEHVALELQCLAGMKVGFGKTRSTRRPSVYSIAYRYRDERSGLRAGERAVELVAAVAEGRPVDVGGIVRELADLHRLSLPGPTTSLLMREAQRRDIPVRHLEDLSCLQLGHGVHLQRLEASLTGRASCIATEIADDKERTKRLLGDAGIPVPHGQACSALEEALAAAEDLGFPLVVKPQVGNHGRGVTTNVQDAAGLAAAFTLAQAIDERVLVERHVAGRDFRVLVIGHRFVAAARREPASVVGDGRHTVRQLVERANLDPRRADGHAGVLTRTTWDGQVERVLAGQQLTGDSVPGPGRTVVLKGTANLSTGGSATDVTAEVHPRIRRQCERASRLVGLDVMGLDIVAPDLREPLERTGGAVVEVNAAPGLRMHAFPSAGRPVNVAAPVMDLLFPGRSKGRIPIVAVTGTNGKTTTVRLVAHILRAHGAKVGLTTTSGVEVDGDIVLAGDYSGPEGARHVLADPLVDHAVLEVARGGILRCGLGFDRCDVGILLNVANDHLGEGEVETLEDLAEVKAVVVENVARDGTAVLNADDPLVLPYADRLRSRVTLVSLDPSNPALAEHVARSGTCVTVVSGAICIRTPAGDDRVAEVKELPVTFEGAAAFNTHNVLAAVAACHALGVPTSTIASALQAFHPTPQALPGRLNVIDMGDHRVVVDYGHNVPAMRALEPVLRQLGPRRAIVMANATGNRRDDDIRAFGRAVAELYDHAVVCDPDPRHRPAGETMRLLVEGLLAGGMGRDHVHETANEEEAIGKALAMATPGDLIVLQVCDVSNALALVERRRKQILHGAETMRRPPRPAPATAPDGPVATECAI